MKVTDEMVERALKATPLVDGDKFAPALQGLFVQRRRTILRAALEAALSDVPEPSTDATAKAYVEAAGAETMHWRGQALGLAQRAQAAEAKLAKVRAALNAWEQTAAGHPFDKLVRLITDKLQAILDEAP